MQKGPEPEERAAHSLRCVRCRLVTCRAHPRAHCTHCTHCTPHWATPNQPPTLPRLFQLKSVEQVGRGRCETPATLRLLLQCATLGSSNPINRRVRRWHKCCCAVLSCAVALPLCPRRTPLAACVPCLPCLPSTRPHGVLASRSAGANLYPIPAKWAVGITEGACVQTSSS